MTEYIRISDANRNLLYWLHVDVVIPPWDFAPAGYLLATRGSWAWIVIQPDVWVLWVVDPLVDGLNWIITALDYRITQLEGWRASAGSAITWLQTAMVSAGERITAIERLAGTNIENMLLRLDERLTIIEWQVVESLRAADQDNKSLWDQVWGWVTNDFPDTVGNIAQSAVQAALGPISAPINILVNWADDIQDFFSDPEDWLFARIEHMLERFW